MRIIIFRLSAILLLFTSLSAAAQNQDHNTLKIWVNGACGMCEDRIQKTALRTPGVHTAVWDEHTKMLTVTTGAKFKEDQLHQNIAQVGHDTEKVKAPDDVYENLHACCHYDRSDVPPSQKSKTIRGKVLEELKKGEESPLIGAVVHWLGTSQGSTTDAAGHFELEPHPGSNRLVVSYIGYRPDTVEVKDGFDLDIVLSNTHTLKEVEVFYRKKATEVSFFSPI
ncbi:MAG TPA: carboxypeptidase-like regulatory domain-containing protein, partial [Saprospiraceae bacterium]|nr:carboxypeptidase-like regulatory domain-containing protein [Saprospiraceae bacterium]